MIKAILFDIQGVLYVNGQLDDNLASFIKEKQDQFVFAICTALSDSSKDRLEEDGILDIFKLIVTATDAPYPKDDSRLYTNIAERLNIPAAEILFLDDLIPPIRAARAAGLRAIHYTDPDSFSLNHSHEH